MINSMLIVKQVQLSEEDIKKVSIARVIVSLITVLGVRDIVRQMLK